MLFLQQFLNVLFLLSVLAFANMAVALLSRLHR